MGKPTGIFAKGEDYRIKRVFVSANEFNAGEILRFIGEDIVAMMRHRFLNLLIPAGELNVGFCMIFIRPIGQFYSKPCGCRGTHRRARC